MTGFSFDTIMAIIFDPLFPLGQQHKAPFTLLCFIKRWSWPHRGSGYRPAWDEHALYPRKWCFVLTSESLWPYQQWNACDKSHWASALEKWASVCKTISIYPQRSPLLFFFLMRVFYPVGEALTRCHERIHAASALKGALCHIAAPGPRFFRCWVGGKSSSANVYHMT